MGVPPRSRGAARTLARRSFLIREVILPVQMFIHTAGRSSIVLLLAALAALFWANSPWGQTYSRFWETHIILDLGLITFEETLREWVDDGLMAIFFFVVGLEVKRELVQGDLARPRDAAFPALAALGGMVVPASLYIAFNVGGPGFSGWGIPMATDIAFALGVLALLGSRVPAEAKVFLLALALVDDIGAILVIAVFYTQNLSLTALGVAVLLFACIFAMNRLGLRNLFFYIIVGVLFWAAVLKSGVHATIAGVALGVLTPARPYFGLEGFEDHLRGLLDRFRHAMQRQEFEEGQAVLGQMEELTVGTEAPAERLERQLSPWANYVVLPVFALANAGVVLSGDSLQNALASNVSLGILLGLVLGKPVGVTLLSWLAVRLGVGAKPQHLTWKHVAGIGMLSGIGFTVSLFITGLAFTDQALTAEAKVGILGASVLAGVIGYTYLRLVGKGPDSEAAGDEEE